MLGYFSYLADKEFLMQINIPAKSLVASVNSQIALDKWPFDDGLGDPFWAGGISPKSYRWELEMTLTVQNHGSHLTREANLYNGLDVKVGDWIAGAADGIALKIRSIRSKTPSNITCFVEDVLRYNTFRSVLGDGLFNVPGNAIIFELNEDGDPVLDPVSTGTIATTSFLGNLTSRMKAFHQEDFQIINQTANGFVEGNLISIDSAGDFVKTSDSTIDRIVGTVSSAGPGPNQFLLRPTTKILEQYEPALPGSIGDFIYAATTIGTDLTTTKTPAVSFLQLSDAVSTISNGSVANATTITGAKIAINGTVITLDNNGGGTESIDDVVLDINIETGTTSVTASKVTIVRTTLSLFYGSVVSLFGGGAGQATINGTLITFNDDTFGQFEFGSNIANEQDLANSINAGGIANLEATFNNEELILVETSGGTITIVNTTNDDGASPGAPFGGASSVSGLVLITTDTFLRLERLDGGEIIVQNDLGDPVGDMGVISVHNGNLPLALVVEQGIRKGDMFIVADIAARDALDVLVGDQAYVIDKGDSDWGLFLWDGSVWVQTATEESARVDSRSLFVDIDETAAAITFIGEVNSGVRVSPVTIEVTEIFDGTPTINVGDVGDNSRLFEDANVDLASLGTYESTPSFQYTSGSDTIINVYFTAGGATQGTARVTITYS